MNIKKLEGILIGIACVIVVFMIICVPLFYLFKDNTDVMAAALALLSAFYIVGMFTRPLVKKIESLNKN